MMKAKLLLILCIAFFQNAKSQTYTLDPASTVNVVAPYEELSIFDIYQINNTDSNVVFGWSRVSVNLPVGWDYSLCDYPNCYTGIPASGTMDSVGAGYMGFLGVNINPFSIAGQGIVKIYVYDINFPSYGDTLTWIINSSPVSVEEMTHSFLGLYPNPVKDFLTIDSDENLNGTVWNIFSLDGKLIISGIFNASGVIDVQFLPKGMYVLHLTGDGQTRTAKFSRME